MPIRVARAAKVGIWWEPKKEKGVKKEAKKGSGSFT
jgi:hypothetical protein